MANSKFEYVRNFETPDPLLPNTWVVVRVDGRAFTKMCAKYNFEKPNDRRALDLMNTAAKAVVADLPEITLAYGKSQQAREHRGFYLHIPLRLFVVDSFSRCSSLVSATNFRCWRQVDCHINNLYNTTFWTLIQSGGLDNKEAEKALAGTLAADKNEILFSRFSINYNNEPEIYRKGSVVFRDVGISPLQVQNNLNHSQYELVDPESNNIAQTIDSVAEPIKQSKTQTENDKKRRAKARILVEHLDIIKDDFWDRRPWILSNKPGKIPKET
ncbi:hypothetical protein AK830_g9190 [Neonectria ditissima]|uniref:tRNA(His) guanylyltransferase n=1 Tax=Neonectria ditissima TaxID=78410 RepID=A0A0P7BAC4_9HYPO|nr:hypothetical protein AK830_g9190 [Neonectria ditissima]